MYIVLQRRVFQRQQACAAAGDGKVKNQRIRMPATEVGDGAAWLDMPLALEPRGCALDAGPESAIGKNAPRRLPGNGIGVVDRILPQDSEQIHEIGRAHV